MSSKQLVVQTLQIESKAAINWFTFNDMLTNPHKFQAFFLASADMGFKFEIDDITLVAEKYVKLLGVNLDKKLNYDTPLQQICKKAGNHLNALKIFSPYISVNYRIAIFRCFVLCYFKLCSIVWHFCGVGNTERWKNSGERAAFCLRRLYFNYDSLLCKSKNQAWNRRGEETLQLKTTWLLHIWKKK